MNIVRKYGGACIDTVEKICDLAEQTAKEKTPDDRLVIVMAAMNDTSKAIMDMARQISQNISEKDLDTLFSAGEQQAAALMSVALEEEGLEVKTVFDIKGNSIKDREYAENLTEIDTDEIESALSAGKTVVVSGFQGIGEYDQKDTYGRNGAASTAVAIAAQLGCGCELYGDADGIYTMDPQICPQAKIIKKLSYEEVMEMILLGENPLESRAIELASTYDVELRIDKPFGKGGTRIMSQNLIVESTPVSGVSISENAVIYTLKGISNKGDAVAALFDALGNLDINIDMISQQSESKGTCTVSFSCEASQAAGLEDSFNNIPSLDGIDVSKQDGLSMVSIVGVGMASHTGVASKVFSVLASEGIEHYQITTSEISISVTVDRENRGKAVVALGEAFNL